MTSHNLKIIHSLPQLSHNTANDRNEQLMFCPMLTINVQTIKYCDITHYRLSHTKGKIGYET